MLFAVVIPGIGSLYSPRFRAIIKLEEKGQDMFVLLAAILGTLIPSVCYILFVWWLDRYEKEPLWLLALAFLWGAGPAASLSILVELVVDMPISLLGGESLAANLLSIGIGAPIIEETFKGVALIGLVILFRREFDDVLDGIVYGAMIGFGFALTENTLAYSAPILQGQATGAGLVVILLRTVVFGANHAFWTGITGAAIGYARLSHDLGRRLLVPVGGWALAVLFHSIHNIGAAIVEQTVCLSLGASLMVDWGGVVLLLLVATLTLRRESQWIAQGLAEEVRQGRLTAHEFEMLRSAGQRLWLRWEARSRGGREASRAVGDYFQCATELAFKRKQLHLMGDEGGNLAEIERLQRELASRRAHAWPWLWPIQP